MKIADLPFAFGALDAVQVPEDVYVESNNDIEMLYLHMLTTNAKNHDIINES